MKKFLSMLAIAAMVAFAAGCDDDDDDDNSSSEEVSYAAPTITWESNPTFESQSLSDDMDVVLDVTAEAGIASFVLDIQSDALSERLTAFGISTTIDLVTDATVVALLNTICGGDIPSGSDVGGQTSVSIDISSLLPLILQVSESGTSHVFVITVTDSEDQSATATLTFTNDTEDEDETSGVTITWESNSTFEQQTITSSMDVVVDVSAPAGIAEATLDIESTVLVATLSAMGIPSSLDLINDTTSMATLNTLIAGIGGTALPYGDDVLNQTSITIDISVLVPMIASLGASSGSEHNFTLTITDANGETATAVLSFVVA